MIKTSNMVILTIMEDDMSDDRNWENEVKGILKAELKRRNVSYKELADRLAPFGIRENERNIANKIARGSFTAVFLLQCLVAIGCNNIRLTDNQ